VVRWATLAARKSKRRLEGTTRQSLRAGEEAAVANRQKSMQSHRRQPAKVHEAHGIVAHALCEPGNWTLAVNPASASRHTDLIAVHATGATCRHGLLHLPMECKRARGGWAGCAGNLQCAARQGTRGLPGGAWHSTPGPHLPGNMSQIPETACQPSSHTTAPGAASQEFFTGKQG